MNIIIEFCITHQRESLSRHFSCVKILIFYSLYCLSCVTPALFGWYVKRLGWYRFTDRPSARPYLLLAISLAIDFP